MLESVYIGMTGLMGYSQGLRVIANNTANINTPGFKGSTMQFADLFSSGDQAGGLARPGSGHGLGTGATTLNFRQGELRQTNNELDLAISGEGLFTLRDDEGKLHYTRAGQFQFDSDGVLVSRINGARVMAVDAEGKLSEVSIANARLHAGKPTTGIALAGNLSSTADSHTVGGIKVFDAAGGEHSLTMHLSAVSAGVWDIAVTEGDSTVGGGQIEFQNGSPNSATAKLSVVFTPPGQAPVPLTFDFTQGVTSFASGDLSTLDMSKQDGFGAAALTRTGFDTTGNLVLTYANGQTVRAARLALGRFDSIDAVAPAGNNEFDAVIAGAWHVGFAGTGAFGSVSSGMIEVSNVDLSQEFSELVIMQRGYQASSQIVSTANDMLQELFSMKGK